MALREPISYNSGFWNTKNFYGLVQQKGPWENQKIDDLKREPQPLPAGVVGKGGTLHAGHNYWNLDTTFMSDIHTLGDTGSLMYHTAPAINTGKPFVGGGARLRKVGKKKSFLDPNTLKHFAQLAEFLGKYPGDGEPKDADLLKKEIKSEPKSPSEPLGGLGSFDKEQKNIGTSPYLSPVELNIPGVKEEVLDDLAKKLKAVLEKTERSKINTNIPLIREDFSSYDMVSNYFKSPLMVSDSFNQTSPRFVSDSFNQTSPRFVSGMSIQTSPVTPTDVIMMNDQGIQVVAPNTTISTQVSPVGQRDVFQQFVGFKSDAVTQSSPIIDKRALRDLKIQQGLMAKIFKLRKKDFGDQRQVKRLKPSDEEVIDVDIKMDGQITRVPTEFTSAYFESVEREATELGHFTRLLEENETRRNRGYVLPDVDDTSTMAGSPTESLRGMAIPAPIIVTDVVDARTPQRVLGALRPKTVKPVVKKEKGPFKINTTALAGPSSRPFRVQLISPNEASTTPVTPRKTNVTLPLPAPEKPKRKKKVVSIKGSVASRTRSKAPVSSRTRSSKK